MPHADEVLVVDDGSVDETRQQARTAGAMVLSHDENQGYGATLGTIFEYASHCNAAHLVIIDADGQHDVTDIPDLIRTQQETGVEIVTGSRFSGGFEKRDPPIQTVRTRGNQHTHKRRPPAGLLLSLGF
ncbi:glycosyltransferase family 2 protein [Natrialbaceae archaeon GCM10025896]